MFTMFKRLFGTTLSGDTTNGHGVMQWPNNNIYDGQWRNGKMHGEELYFENGKLVEKNLWENGKFIRHLPVN